MKPELDMKKTMAKVTMTVKLKKYHRTKIRIWAGLLFMKLSALIMGVEFKFENIDGGG